MKSFNANLSGWVNCPSIDVLESLLSIIRLYRAYEPPFNVKQAAIFGDFTPIRFEVKCCLSIHNCSIDVLESLEEI